MKGKSFIIFRGLFYCFLALIFGLTLARGIFSGEVKSLCIAIVSLVLLSGFLIFRKKFVIMAVMIVFFFGGCGLYFANLAVWNEHNYFSPVAVVGRVSDQVYDYENMQKVILKDVTVDGKGEKNINLTIFTNDNKVKSGDMLSFVCELDTVKLFTFGNFNTFAFRNRVGYSTTMSSDNIVVSDGFIKVDERYRLYVKNLLEKGMNEDSAGICFAVLFGDKHEVPSEIKSAFQDSGIIHLLAVSGLHVGFLIALLNFFLKKCRVNRFIAFVIVLVFLFVYAWLCGFSPSVLRAGIMAIVVLGARLTSRRYDRLTSLGIAGFIIILTNPLSAFDVGFLMSFFCVSSIFFAFPLMSKIFGNALPKKVADSIAISISAQLGILPFISFFSGSFNLLSVFANLLILPIFGLVYPILFVAVIFVSILPFTAPALIVFEWLFTFMVTVAYFFSKTSLKISLSKLDNLIIICFFIILFALSRYLMVNSIIKGLVVSSCLFVIAVVSVFNLSPVRSESIDVLFDYSHSTVITSKSGECLVIGDINMSSFKEYSTYCKITTVDYYLSDKALTNKNIEFVNNYNCKIAMTTDSKISENEKVFEIEFNKSYTLGDFVVRYVKRENIMIGIEISYSSHSIFVASSKSLSYNENEVIKTYLSTSEFDIAVLGLNNHLKDCFKDETITITERGENLSSQNYGNIRIVWQNGRKMTYSLD